MSEFEQQIAADRYGGVYPDPETVCQGQCEGMGHVPHYKGDGVVRSDPDPRYDALWDELHRECVETGCECDGWHFVKCPDCDGTGKLAALEAQG